MLSFLLGRGAVSLTVISLLTSSVAGEVFEKLRAVPEGESAVITDASKRLVHLN